MPSTTLIPMEQSLSIYWEARQEALRHKWIESEKRGYDLGDRALAEWYHTYWNTFCRWKCLEHVRGQQFWEELEAANNFGRLYDAIVQGCSLTRAILDRVSAGEENLTIIQWAWVERHPMEDVIQLLAQININHARLDHDFDC